MSDKNDLPQVGDEYWLVPIAAVARVLAVEEGEVIWETETGGQHKCTHSASIEEFQHRAERSRVNCGADLVKQNMAPVRTEEAR